MLPISCFLFNCVYFNMRCDRWSLPIGVIQFIRLTGCLGFIELTVEFSGLYLCLIANWWFEIAMLCDLVIDLPFDIMLSLVNCAFLLAYHYYLKYSTNVFMNIAWYSYVNTFLSVIWSLLVMLVLPVVSFSFFHSFLVMRFYFDLLDLARILHDRYSIACFCCVTKRPAHFTVLCRICLMHNLTHIYSSFEPTT